MMNKKTPIYLDHNATTPMAQEVLDVYVYTAKNYIGNASSFDHIAGYEAGQVVKKAREQVAKLVGCEPKEIYFTSGSSESNNIAIIGLIEHLRKLEKTELITTAIEHPSVLECFRFMESDGFKVHYVKPNESGVVSVEDIENLFSDKTGLVSLMAANNETGMFQPYEELADICSKKGILLHCDFSQAMALTKLDLKKTRIDLLSLSSHKAYGPKGVGAIYIRARRPSIKLKSIFHGGGQERKLRPGTLNTPGIAGFGKCAELISKYQKKDAIHQQNLKCQLANGLLEIEGAVINSELDQSLPNTFSLSISGINPRALMRSLRDKVIFSASSACTTDKVEPSHVLTAMFSDYQRINESFRIGIGRGTTQQDITDAIQLFKEHVTELRSDFI